MPEDTVERLDRLVDDAADQIHAARSKLRESTGDRPWGSRELPAKEKMQRFAATWEDDALWLSMVNQERAVYALGPDAAPKRLIHEAIELAKQLQESSDQ